MTDASNPKLQQQYDGTRLAAAAYGAEQFKVLLATNPSPGGLIAGVESILVQQGFSPAQASIFVAKYTPVAALDQDGAGAVLFKVNGTNEIATAVRGTEKENNFLSDVVHADGTIAQNQLPVYQTTLIANFVLRETTPAGQPVPQFSVQGGNSNTADLARATADTLANAGGEKGDAPNLVTMPVIVQTGTAIGTGNAVGQCVDAAAHSEGAPEITTLGSAIAQCSRITTVNGPGVSLTQMQSVSDQIAAQADRPQQDIASQNQLNVHTTGVSVIDGLNGGLPGEDALLTIPGNSHSSIVAMNAAEAQYKASTGEGVTDYGVVEVTAPRETHTLDNYLQTEGATLTTKQQDALATQLDKLNLGGEGDLSFYSLPNGGALIANADGDIVGEINRSSTGDLNLKATAISADGSSIEVSSHIQQNGEALTEGEYNAQTQKQASAMFNSLMAANNWDHLSDVGKLSALVNLYNATDKLGEAFGASGNNLPGDLGAAAGWLSLAQGIQSGDDLIIANGINIISDGALDSAMNQAFGNTAAGEAVPYLSYALAIRNFADNPEQAILTAAGTYVGEAFGAAIGGPIGAAIGGAIGGMIGGALGDAFGFGDDDPPPPPEGATHFSWDANGNIQHTVDYNQSGGGDAANSVAASVLGLLEQVVHAINGKNPSTADDVALNPYLIPKVGFSGSSAWIEVSLPDGTTVREGINSETIATRLIELLQDNGGLAPAWQVQTVQAHAQRLQEQGASEADVHRGLTAGIGGQAVAGTEAYAIQGSASESADFKSQSFGALVVHVGDNPAVQAHTTALSEVLRDIENDSYVEKTEWVAAKDSAGNAQGLLILDFNQNGLIETRDILNLGGNKGQEGNPTDEARLATQNANLQRNNVEWLDANGDGQLTAQDPAFAAIKLWIDVNQDGQMQAGEGQSLESQHISSINFKTGEVTYDDGHSDALTAATLKADTEGVKFTQIQAVNPDGTLHTLDAGMVLEHEGYQGKVQITDEGGTRWASAREQTYEQQAKRTGDWEGTAVQDAHRHGGGNVEGALTQTTATGATDFGPIKTQANHSKQSTVTEGDVRVVSDAPKQATPSQTNAQTTIATGDIRIKSYTATPSTTNTNTSNSTPRPADTRVVFVPASQTSVQNEIQAVTSSMIENSQSLLFGASANAGLGVLAAVGMGAVQSVQATEQRPTLVSDGVSSSVSTTPNSVSSNNTFTTTLNGSSTDTSAPSVIFKQVDLGLFNTPQVVQVTTPTLSSHSSITPLTASASTEPASTAFVYATVIVSAPVQVLSAKTPTSVTASEIASGVPMHPVSTAATLGYPAIQGEKLFGTEDAVLRLTQSVLLANDSTPNASADPGLSALTITAVSQPLHGQVSLVNGEVLFAPDTNFHGTASFTYTVTDQYGLSSNGTATLQIAAVNDAPVTQGELVTSDEDFGLIFTQAQLLANDSDVDVATDGQALSINRVGQAEHGMVWLDPEGNLRFVPDANYHGPAKFTYWVSDGLAANGAGAETPATMNLTIAAVNDIPVAQGESTNTTEDTTLSIDAAKLLANDSDVDEATDGQVLSISGLSNAAHCTVSLLTQADGKQQITFVPDTNFHGTATFDYTISDGNGGTAIATAVVNLSAVNDAPLTRGETATGDEDLTFVFTSHDLLANDTDVDIATDGQVLSINRVGLATHGTVTLDAQGHVHFKPEENYHGPAQFTYWVSDGLAADGAGAEVPATVSLTILAVNDLPVVTGETLNTLEDTTLLFNTATLLANDTDVDVATDDQVLSITAVSHATHGTVAFVMQPDGSQQIRFTPEANYFGLASYQYTVSDGAGGNTVGTVVMNLAQVNDAPVAADDILSNTLEDTALHISFASLLGNDSDADSHNSQWGGTDDVLTITVVGNAVHGTVALMNGEVVFTPDANYHGPASFAYQVSDSSGAVSQALATFSVTGVNDAPAAVGETISENEDTTLVINQAALLQNDSDVDTATDGQMLTITAVSNAQHGMVTLNANGTISFVPDANFYGNASFDYTVNDGNGGTATTTATIALANVNDAPVATGETVNSNEDEVLTITASALLQNDSDIDNAHADLTISRVQSGTGGTVSLSASGNVVFTPTLNYNGTATFTYWVKDPGGLESNAVTTTVVLAPVNDAPKAQGEIVTGASEDAAFNINASTLLANDHDVDDPDSALRLSWVGNASNGEVSLDANGNVVYKFTKDFNGNATFEYKVRDAAGLESAIVQAVIPVMPVNDKPVAVDDQFTTYKNSTMSIAFNQLTSNDTDADHDPLTVSAVRDHANGHASIVNGQVQFVATTGFTGVASFDYLTDDGHGGQAWATAFVDVISPPNQYATVTYLRGQGQPYYPFMSTAKVWFSIEDDGEINKVQMLLSSASYRISTNGYATSLAWQDAANQFQIDRNNGYFSVNFDGAHYFDLFKSTWRIIDSNGLENIWHFEIVGHSGGASNWIFQTISYNDHYGYYYPPLVMDLNDDGVHFTSVQNSNIEIDVNFDGIKDKMAWAGNDDGVLVWDKDHNHQISDASEFGFQALKAGAQTDLEGLQALDTNGNGLLDAGDAKFAEFAVWQDANGNGVTDAGEFNTLIELGIANINLKSDGQVREAGTLLASSGSGETDATVMGNAAFTRTDGTKGVVADTMLAYEVGHTTQSAPKVTELSTAEAQTAEVIRQALLFNQVCNTAHAIDMSPLGFVPIQPDVQMHDMPLSTHDGSHPLMQPA